MTMETPAVPPAGSGVPLVESDPNAPAAAMLEDLAFLLSKPEHRKAPPGAKANPALQRALARLSAAQAARGKAG